MASSIDILVPAAHALIGDWYDLTPAAADGMPPHLTLLWPWLETMSETALTKVAAVANSVPAFEVEFATTGRFPGVLYLSPSPAGAVVDLMSAFWSAFPETPPYGGELDHEPIPHLTVAKSDDDEHLDKVAVALAQRLPEPLVIRVDRVSVSQEGAGIDGAWGVIADFALARRSR